MTQPMSEPFVWPEKVRKAFHPVTVNEALRAAREAGYVPTARSTADRAHVQRRWNNAASIRSVPNGVVIAPAWSNQQILAVLVVLTLLICGVCAL